MTQIRSTHIRLSKARFGWYAHLLDQQGLTVVRPLWRPTKDWAFGAMVNLRDAYIWG